MYGKTKIPVSIWIVVIAAIVFTFLRSPNVLLSIFAFLYIPFAYRIFFIKGDVNVIFWSLMYQWLSVATQLMYCTVFGIPLNDLFKGTIFPADLMEYTDVLSIAGIYFFTLGIF